MMTVSDIWKVKDDSVVKIDGREYLYNNADGKRLITDVTIGDEHYVSEWFTGDEEIEWIRG